MSNAGDDLGPIPDWGDQPPQLPEIVTTDDESLVADILEQLCEFSDEDSNEIASWAVIVEVTEPLPEPGPSMEGAFKTKGKGKNTHPKEKWHLYNALHKGAWVATIGKGHQPLIFAQGPERFKRAKADKPDGGWFHSMTKSPTVPSSSESSSDSSSGDDGDEGSPGSPNSSNSDSSSSSSSSSSSDPENNSASHCNGTHHHGKSTRSKARKIKIKNPFTYDGLVDLDMFDCWCYEVDVWCESHGASEKEAVKYLVQFMSGKAGHFFVKHIAHYRDKWTTKLVYKGLFDYCFPAHFKLELQEKLMSTVQGPMNVRDFA